LYRFRVANQLLIFGVRPDLAQWTTSANTNVKPTNDVRADWLSAKYETFGYKTTSAQDIGHQKVTDNRLNRDTQSD
jgi:hypothetical protein